LFEEQVTRTPDAPAVIFGDQCLSYRELNERANQLGHYLQKLGVGPEVLVAICVERSLEMIVGLLGILKAGGAYVPLDPSYPSERLLFMLQDAAAPVLLTQSTLDLGLAKGNTHTVFLDRDWPDIAHEGRDNVQSAVQPDNLVYVIYTSGSTGNPKGVMVEHLSCLNLIGWHVLTFQISLVDNATQIAGPSFDAMGWEIWPYLSAGASVTIVDDD
jgi:non-ribosomal peptide synthetase component F